jgi:hypothetical protein
MDANTEQPRPAPIGHVTWLVETDTTRYRADVEVYTEEGMRELQARMARDYCQVRAELY